MSNISGKDIEYQAYTLGDIGVIELLISYRYKYDDYLFLSEECDRAFDVIGTSRINEEVLVTYVALDMLVERCKFNEHQLKMIELVGEGYSYEEIALIMKIRLTTIAGRLKTIYKKIIKENEWAWQAYIYTDKLKLRTKTCTKCKEKLPGTVEFYSDDSRNKDGFQGQCRKCKM